jgi:hypothetical protein
MSEDFAEKVASHLQYGASEEALNAVASVVDTRLNQRKENERRT